MFGLKSKEQTKNKKEKLSDEVVSEKFQETVNAIAEESASAITEIAVADGTESVATEKHKTKKTEKADKIEDVSDFYRIAEILCTDKNAVLEECKLYGIRKIMAKLSRAVVRYGLSNGEMKTLVKNAGISGLGEIAVSPAYLNDLAVHLKGKEEIKVCAVIDFPFGEASFKVKMSEIKNSIKQGVDGVLTVLNASEIKNDNGTALKKQLRKIGKVKGVIKGVAVSAEDLNKDDIKRFLRLGEKANFDYAAFLFGNVSESELNSKMKDITDVKGAIAVKVMANVEDLAGVKALIKSGADGIITPFAETIAKELFAEFKITDVKLS